jgi:cupin superfamily protein
VQEGRQIGLGDYASDVSWRPPFTSTADVPRVVDQWEAGATIVLQALHVSWHPLAVFCRALEDALGHGVQANSYYTPRGSQGFAVHHDTHDVLILQVAGVKRWLIYEPLLELPLKHQRYSKALGAHGEPTDDLVLKAGDSLYLPRGWLHQAETSSSDSLHLTIGIAAHTWVDAARAALDACEGELAFRRGVEHAGGDGLADLIAEQLDPELVERRRRRKFVDSRRPIRADGLSQLRALQRLDAETPLERRETVIADLDERPDGLRLVFEGKQIGFPTHASPEVRACFESDEPFRLADLPGELDDDGRLVLARRLVREGFLRVTD